MGQVRRWIDWIYVFITGNAVIFWACMVINMIGVVWGGIVWYGPMLVSSPAWAWIFIPDCPAAALYATVAFVLLRYQRPVPWFTAFAAFACIKYGLWTLAFWTRHWLGAGTVEPLEVMLFVSHIGLTCEGVLLATRLGWLGMTARALVAAFFSLSILVDYGLGFHPPLTRFVTPTFALWTAVILTSVLGFWLTRPSVVVAQRAEALGVQGSRE
ncbi:DUF1405 domain-containing protein [Chloroflexus sp. MS-CIW-1]|jgi:uncharacterized membrane protein YpjA|uniref:DUF1405 domain-containing protein n=1 Tax=unclassified Chloroflexus TaxID=2633855 RepID=UPI0004DF128D|nr:MULTISPECIES: DUF1405 domain-containing protein [unclassified Chloroflexus]MBO9347478.1 DUF1405 domain-containing protein [Chloroflexus sp.]MDN5270352.1 DUF1405 domain-containing protein [Chloroflexus sp. MS-CIW-1]